MGRIARILPHIAIILAAVLITLLILDYYNPNMYFYDNETTRVMFLVFCVAALANGVIMVVIDRKTIKKRIKKAAARDHDKNL